MTLPKTLPIREVSAGAALLALALAANFGLQGASSLRLAWDPRGRSALEGVEKARESDAFRSRLSRGTPSLTWPGLKQVQIDMTWLRLLQAVHVEGAYDRDFSWIFGKLFFVSENADPREKNFITALSPFFFVIGKDPVGATVVMEEIIRRAPDRYNTWFWSGYHAMENLASPSLAADLYARAARFPQAPDYLAALSLRLQEKSAARPLSTVDRDLLLRQMDPTLREKLERVRPDLFR